MIFKQTQDKGILALLLERGINILVKKECKYIGEIKIDIKASSAQIIRGIIKKINITGKDINYKDLLFDELELEANEIKIIFKINDMQIDLKKNIVVKFKISFSESSLKKILSSTNWSWIANMISKEILNQGKLEDIKINCGQLLIKSSRQEKGIYELERVDLKVEKGDLYLQNIACNKSIKIPVEDKLNINNITIKNNLINIFADSTLSFN